jgi:pSer/pThr/pTyr-binding forkhead associated (FHA) protein
VARLIGRTGPAAGCDFVVADSANLGASAENDVRIAAPGVSRRHARVWREGNQFWVEDTGATNGTFVNGGRIQRETLRHLDVVTLGRAVDLIFLASEDGPVVPAADRVLDVKLEYLDGAEAGTTIDVPKGEITLGRAPSCNVVLASQAISKVHARIQRTGSQIVLQDLQSANNTFLNGRRVETVVPLADGDVISFAGVRGVTVRIKGQGDAKAEGVQATFDQEWKTRFAWGPEELAVIEKARAEAIALAALRSPGVEKDVKKAAPKPSPPPPAPKGEAAAAKPAAPPAPAPKAAAPPPPAPKPQPSVALSEGATVPARDAIPPVRPRISGIRLVGVGGPISLGLGTFLVGRGATADVRLEDVQASRSHASIVVAETGITVEDLKTVNGTLLNGLEVKAPLAVKNGDVVRFGGTEFKIDVISS